MSAPLASAIVRYISSQPSDTVRTGISDVLRSSSISPNCGETSPPSLMTIICTSPVMLLLSKGSPDLWEITFISSLESISERLIASSLLSSPYAIITFGRFCMPVISLFAAYIEFVDISFPPVLYFFGLSFFHPFFASDI